ncbi:hypothetical protein EJB05_20635, partial [Eragrostis curvula]
MPLATSCSHPTSREPKSCSSSATLGRRRRSSAIGASSSPLLALPPYFPPAPWSLVAVVLAACTGRRGVVFGLPAYLRLFEAGTGQRRRVCSCSSLFRDRHDLQTCLRAKAGHWDLCRCGVRPLNLMAADLAAYFCGIDISLGVKLGV